MTLTPTATAIALSLYEGLLKIQEQQTPNMAAVAPVASPTPTPTQQAPGNMPPPEAPQTPAAEPQFTGASLENIIDSLNVIRGGPSFEKPEVYNGLTSIFNGLSDVEKAAVDKVLKEIQNVMIGKPEQSQGQQVVNPTSATPPMQMMQATQRAATMGASSAPMSGMPAPGGL